MASLSTAKVLGGVGGILAIIPGISLVGWILILVAMKEISDVTQSGAFWGVITLGAIDFGVFGVLGALALLGTFWFLLTVSSVFLKRTYDKIAQRLNVGAFATAGLLYLIGALTVIVLVGFLILLIAMVFQIVAYFSVQDQPAPPLYPGYQPPQQMPTPIPQVIQPQATPPQPVPEFKFCFKCGTRLPASAVYCTNCGTKQS
ncbi:DUF996 domain-containing protein [Candidatus Bathyarchaeota archaeon]|nr:MAG: DUF996 domain-containing protein [Candidatus Bathyarchaeota archaeon]